MALGIRHLRAAAVLVLIGGLFAVAFLDAATAWFVIPAAIGGAATGLLLFLTHRTHTARHLEDATDAPASVPTGIFNMSSVSPAGIGGLGLVAMALILAFTFQRIGESLAVGLAGGMAAAALLIAYRRRHGVFDTDRRQAHLPH
jgi:hypothetical protein